LARRAKLNLEKYYTAARETEREDRVDARNGMVSARAGSLHNADEPFNYFFCEKVRKILRTCELMPTLEETYHPGAALDLYAWQLPAPPTNTDHVYKDGRPVPA